MVVLHHAVASTGPASAPLGEGSILLVRSHSSPIASRAAGGTFAAAASGVPATAGAGVHAADRHFLKLYYARRNVARGIVSSLNPRSTLVPADSLSLRSHSGSHPQLLASDDSADGEMPLLPQEAIAVDVPSGDHGIHDGIRLAPQHPHQVGGARGDSSGAADHGHGHGLQDDHDHFNVSGT